MHVHVPGHRSDSVFICTSMGVCNCEGTHLLQICRRRKEYTEHSNYDSLRERHHTSSISLGVGIDIKVERRKVVETSGGTIYYTCRALAVDRYPMGHSSTHPKQLVHTHTLKLSTCNIRSRYRPGGGCAS